MSSGKPWLAAVVSDLLPSRSRTGENRAAHGRREGQYRVISTRPRTPRCEDSQPQRLHDSAFQRVGRPGARELSITHLGVDHPPAERSSSPWNASTQITQTHSAMITIDQNG